jgi:hypothetical protein
MRMQTILWINYNCIEKQTAIPIFCKRLFVTCVMKLGRRIDTLKSCRTSVTDS